MVMNLILIYRSEVHDSDDLGKGRHRKMVTPLLLSNIC
jgi:hypothetical protein